MKKIRDKVEGRQQQRQMSVPLVTWIIPECCPSLGGPGAHPENPQPWQKQPSVLADWYLAWGGKSQCRSTHRPLHTMLTFPVDSVGNDNAVTVWYLLCNGSLWESSTEEHREMKWFCSPLASQRLWQRIHNLASICWAPIMCETNAKF